MADWRSLLLDDDLAIRRELSRARTIAVVGAKSGPGDDAYQVPAYLHRQGYRVRAVNPRLAGRELFGAPAVATLLDLTEPVDIVGVFRAPANVAAHADEALALPRRPQLVWLQVGIRDEASAERLARAGIEVVQDRCLLVDHRRLLGER